MRRDSDGKIIDSLWTRFKGFRMRRQMAAGKIPRGRTTPSLSRSETQRAFLLKHETAIVQTWNTGKREKELAEKYDVDLGNFQSFVRYLKNIERIAK